MTTTDLKVAAAAIRRGDVVAAPTDTLVGLLACANDERAVASVLAIKGAERQAPLPVLIEDMEMALQLAASFPEAARLLAERGWPGPLTLVVRAQPGVLPDGITAGRPTVGLRIPGPSPALNLLREVHMPLTGTSANPTGCPPPTSSADLDERVVATVEVVLAGGGSIGIASTVVDATGDELRILRQGSFELEPQAAGPKPKMSEGA